MHSAGSPCVSAACCVHVSSSQRNTVWNSADMHAAFGSDSRVNIFHHANFCLLEIWLIQLLEPCLGNHVLTLMFAIIDVGAC